MRRLRFPCLLALLLVLSHAAAAEAPTPLPGLDAAAGVVRDADGIPHIFAADEHDLFFLQGWVHAEDRLFQMDVSRRQASGTLAEILGPAALPSDVQLRTIGLERAAERSLPLLSPPVKAAFEAYSDGVNAFIAAHPLPPEYAALELGTVEPWTPLDCMVVSKLLAFSLSFELDITPTLALLGYQQAGAVAGFDGAALYFQDLFRTQPFDSVATVPDATGAALAQGIATTTKAGAGAGRSAAALSPAAAALAARYLEKIRGIGLLRRAIAPGERNDGSNEWVIGGKQSATGRPLLANDPHLTLSLPALFHEIHLAAGDIDVTGSSLPGVPFVVLGHNRFIAWGATTNDMDVTDTFQEQVVPDPSSPSHLSIVHNGQNEPIIPIPQVFRYNRIGDGTLDNLAVASAPEFPDIPPVVLIVPRRNNGPILALNPAAGTALSVQYTGFSGTREPDAFYAFDGAHDLADFEEGLQHFDFGSQNFAYADVFGTIAYFTSAAMPLREDLQGGTVDGLPPFFIRDGRGLPYSSNEWLPEPVPPEGQVIPYQLLPFAEMPQVVNPATGVIVNANNDPNGDMKDNNPLDKLRPTGGIFYLAPTYQSIRAARITEMLRERLDDGDKLTLDDLKTMQADTVLRDAEVFTPYLLAAFRHATARGAHPALAALAADPRIAAAAGRLKKWRFTTPTGLAAGFDAANQSGKSHAGLTHQEIDESVAATIYSVWRGQVLRNTIDAMLQAISSDLVKPDEERALAALRHLLDDFDTCHDHDTCHGVGASGLNFFNGPGDPATRRDFVLLKSLGDTLTRLAGDDFAPAFHHSTNQDDYRWGRLHRIVLDHPLGVPFSAPPAGGAFPPPLADLPGIPTDGGFQTVDAARHDVRAAKSDDFMFKTGPAQRFVANLSNGHIQAETSLPGGESGVIGSPHYVDLLERWLSNETFPLRMELGEIQSGSSGLEQFAPAGGSHVAASSNP